MATLRCRPGGAAWKVLLIRRERTKGLGDRTGREGVGQVAGVSKWSVVCGQPTQPPRLTNEGAASHVQVEEKVGLM